MVVKEDGSKWACQSCLKGHRVSGCTHTDRELTLVPKKGRPVTQCQHCRLERKKRSAHVKCDCGEADKPHHPREKCIHLREAEERAKAGLLEDHPKEDDPHHLMAVAEEQGCCCHHGGKCSCSIIKKESSGTDDSPPHGPAVHKPRLESTRSDGSITVFANGHHKPVHKRNHAAHESGMPYKLPMPRAQTYQSVSPAARRSVDSLALDSTSSRNALPDDAQAQHPLCSTQRRKSRSEQASPMHSAIVDSKGVPFDAIASPNELSALGPIQTNQSIDSSMGDSMGFPPLDPMSATADGAFDPWAVLPSSDSTMPNNNPFGVWATQFDGSCAAQPALTAASSGTQSEVDEIPTMEDLYGYPMPSIQEDLGTSEVNSIMDDPFNPNRRSLPPGFFGNAEFSMPGVANEWSNPIDGMSGSDQVKAKVNGADQGFSLDDVWNTPTMPTMSSIAHSPTKVTPTSSQSQPLTGASGSAPNEDIIKQLFPEIDIDSSMFGTDDRSGAMYQSKAGRSGDLPAPSSMAMDLGPMDESVAFMPQSWTDGSLSIPNDAFTTPYNLDQSFSDQDFNGSWSYQ